MTKHINPLVVKAQIASLLVHFPELQDDEEALALSLDSETDATALLSQIVAKLQEAKALSNGTANWISDLRARQDRYDRRQEALRALVFKIMETAGIKKPLELPLATLSIVAGTRKVVITDAKDIPLTFCRIPPPEPDKIKIKETLQSGVIVPGAFLSNGEPHLNIRVK